MDEMVPSTYKDAGSLDYSWYISDDETEVHIFERYKDAEACLEHGATFAPFGARFMDCVSCSTRIRRAREESSARH